MAYCPECNGEMPVTAVECPHCEYRFPATAAEDSNRRPGFEWSPLADIALSVSTVAAVLATLCAFYFGVISLFASNLLDALVVAPISVLILLGIVVVFLRVQKLD